MIPRLLVPEKLSPVSAAPTDGRKRAWTILDDRLVIPAQLPVKPLEAESSIPAHLPLDVLGERTLVPRDAVHGTLELPPAGQVLPPTDADERMAVPVDARPVELIAETFLPVEVLEREDLVTTDVFTTGEVKLLPKQVSELPSDRGWLMPAGSLLVHIVLALIIFGLALVVPHHVPTQAELEASSRSLSLYLPPDSMFSRSKTSPTPAPPGDQLRVDPGLLRKLMPETIPAPSSSPAQQPQAVTPRQQPELPTAPIPQIPQQPTPAPPQRSPAVPSIENPRTTPDAPPPAFKLPSVSPGRALEDSVRGAMSKGGTSSTTFGGAMPRGGGGSMGGGGGVGAGNGYLGGAVQMLTPDQGVDFSGYLNQVVASVRREWYILMPESAKMGDRGRVVIDFKIMRDGSVPRTDPLLRLTSGKEPLDIAALGSIRGASPFPPLPPAFSGPFIELRFIFLYNLPLDAAQ